MMGEHEVQGWKSGSSSQMRKSRVCLHIAILAAVVVVSYCLSFVLPHSCFICCMRYWILCFSVVVGMPISQRTNKGAVANFVC